MENSLWVEAKDGEPTAYAMYRRHYSSKKNKRPKIRLFVGPGEKMVLVGFMFPALFVWRKFIDDSKQTGVNCAVFRNESKHLSSNLILDAMQWAWTRWPGSRLYTSVDAEETKRRRSKRSPPGKCFIHAKWKECGTTKNGLVILEFVPGMEGCG